jgi:hypothetical protein
MAHQHNFVELPSSQARKGYFKLSPDGGYDQSISYTMLYCTSCGETKEVVAADQLIPSVASLAGRSDNL